MFREDPLEELLLDELLLDWLLPDELPLDLVELLELNEELLLPPELEELPELLLVLLELELLLELAPLEGFADEALPPDPPQPVSSAAASSALQA
jgi:hypothetical protein